MSAHLRFCRIYQAYFLVVIAFISAATAKSVVPHDYQDGKTATLPPPPLYMTLLSMHLGPGLERIDQQLRYYHRCHNELIHPNGSQIQNYWQCEQAWFPEHLLLDELREVEYYLEFPPSLETINPGQWYTRAEESPPSNIAEELSIHYNMYNLIDTISSMQRFRAWSTESSMFTHSKNILRLWTGGDKTATNWIDHQYLKYQDFYNEFERGVILRQSLNIAARLERLVLDFRIEPVVRPTLPAEIGFCPSSVLVQWREEISGLSQVCYHRRQGEDMRGEEISYMIPEGPVVFRHFAKPYQREYNCCCEEVDRVRGVDIEAQRIRQWFLP